MYWVLRRRITGLTLPLFLVDAFHTQRAMIESFWSRMQVEVLDRKRCSMVAVDDGRPFCRPALVDCHSERIRHQGCSGGYASIDQPTTRRLKVSRTTAQYTLPSRVACSVMSVNQS